MYSPSPPPVAATNAYVYLNHQQSLSAGQYASRPQSAHQATSLSSMGLAPASGSTMSTSAGASAYPAYPVGMNRYAGGLGWMSRPQASQPAHLAQHYGTTSMSTLPATLSHASVAPSSPGYSGFGSPHNLSMISSSISPVAQPATTMPTSSSTSFANSTPHWQKQLVCADISRQSFSPHHHARAAALAARSTVNHGSDPKKGIHLPAGVVANGLSLPTQDDPSRGDDSFSAKSAPPRGPSAALRTTAADPRETDQSWTIIDMGGLSLNNIGPEVFRYSFLTSLFINHNNLTMISPAIVQLRNLTILDASGNKLIMLPPELGMLTELRSLYLFDNRLTILPPELGTLYQLEMLGIEGNPLQENLLSVLQAEGTQALIAFLRDSCPVPVPPPEREWVALEPDVPAGASDEETVNNTFAVLSYNVLCEKYATAQMYGYTPSWALAWDYRKEFILQEILSYGADICCLQEVEMGQFDDYFEPKLKQSDYEGIFWPKSRARTMRDDERRHVDGCATFYNTRVYKLIDKQMIEFNQIALQRSDFKKTEDIFNRVMTKDNVASIAMLEHRTTGAKLLVANSHMHWDPEFRDVKLVQAAMLMEQIEVTGNHFAKMPSHVKATDGIQPPKYTSGRQIPTVVCGDFNSTPDSGVYEFLSQGSTSPNHDDFMDHKYGTYTSEGLRHDYKLCSAYGNVGELSFTNLTPGFRGVIDYIWYSGNSLAASGLLGEVDPLYLSRVVGFPNAHFPSDHVCILAEFKVKSVKG